MTDIGTALEKLIDVLQLEGHELFRIFTEIQGLAAIGDGVILLCGFIGLFIGAYFGNKWLDTSEKLRDDDIGFIILIAVIGLTVGLILSALGVHIYLHVYYPEYFAAKELIWQIGHLT